MQSDPHLTLMPRSIRIFPSEYGGERLHHVDLARQTRP
jgi:hypothetical protein